MPRSLVVALFVGTGVLGWTQSASEKAEFFEARIRPVLANNCYTCHTDSKLGGLRVDSRVALLEGGKSGAVIVPGRPDESLLIKAVMQVDPKLKMPMGGAKLKDNEIADLRYWIQAMAAFWPTEDSKPAAPAVIEKTSFTIRPEQRKFWSFQPIQKTAAPKVRDTAWAKTPIDRFILAKLEEKNLKPVQPADKQALNQDMPYDRFVKAQIAADLMPEQDRSKLLPALGFFGIGPWFTGDDVVFVEARANERDDKIDALTKGFLGLTVTCARCHNHKYDPISQKDYYALAGVFASSGYWEYDLSSDKDVAAYQDQRNKVKAAETALSEYAEACSIRVAETLAAQI